VKARGAEEEEEEERKWEMMADKMIV